MIDVGLIKGLDWVYSQSTGRLYLADYEDARTHVATCYSGAVGHVNRTESEAIVGRGPIPRGLWRMDPPADHERLGPVCVGLEAADPKTALGRSGFYVHGDNKQRDNTASSGCIVASRNTRTMMERLYWDANVRSLLVID